MKEAEMELATTIVAAITPFLPGRVGPHESLQSATSPPSAEMIRLSATLDVGGADYCGDQGESAAGPREAAANGNHDHAPFVRDCDPTCGAVAREPPSLDAREKGGGSGSGSMSGQLREASGETAQRGGGVGIDMEDLEAALKGFSAEAHRGAGLFRSSVEWGDVGGLRGVRAELREILEVCAACLGADFVCLSRVLTGVLRRT